MATENDSALERSRRNTRMRHILSALAENDTDVLQVVSALTQSGADDVMEVASTLVYGDPADGVTGAMFAQVAPVLAVDDEAIRKGLEACGSADAALLLESLGADSDALRELTLAAKSAARLSDLETRSRLLQGRLHDSDVLQGRLHDSDVLQGRLHDSDVLQGRLHDSDVLQGRLHDSDVLQGRLHDSDVLQGRLHDSDVLQGRLHDSDVLQLQLRRQRRYVLHALRILGSRSLPPGITEAAGGGVAILSAFADKDKDLLALLAAFVGFFSAFELVGSSKKLAALQRLASKDTETLLALTRLATEKPNTLTALVKLV